MTKINRKMLIKQQLLENTMPIKASEFAKQFQVSRQTIVGDVALLRAQGEKIISTARGYEYALNKQCETIVVCRHFPDQAEKELQMIIQHQVEIKDVIVDHPIYGQLVGQLRIRNQNDVAQFMRQVREHRGHLLSELTDGIHSHTLSAKHAESLVEVKQILRKTGILYETE